MSEMWHGVGGAGYAGGEQFGVPQIEALEFFGTCGDKNFQPPAIIRMIPELTLNLKLQDHAQESLQSELRLADLRGYFSDRATNPLHSTTPVATLA
jgi:hypothetical protein